MSPRLSFILAACLSVALPQLAHAGGRLRPETYSATDANAGIAPTGNQAPLPLVAENTTIQPAVPAQVRSVTPSPQPNAVYDAVPIEQTDAFLKRLQIVSEILKKYGRAYDYRIHTVKELESIESELAQPAPSAQTETRSIRVMPSVPPVPVPVSVTMSKTPQAGESRLEPQLQPGVESDANAF